MATLITVAQTALPVGSRQFTSPTLLVDILGYRADITPVPVLWPASGDVLTVRVEISFDDGATWRFDASWTLGGGVWKDKNGNTLLTATLNVSLPQDGITTKKLRLNLDVLQACTVGGTLSSL
jgi:hypothetical protein